MVGAWKLRARWWLAACACALVVRGADACSSPFLCLRNSKDCIKENDHLFFINGSRYEISHHGCDYISISCDSLNLDSISLPHKANFTNFQNVTLLNCPPPRTYYTYWGALLDRNIQASWRFHLSIPANTTITAASLLRLPPILEIHAVDGILVVEPGAMAKLNGVIMVNVTGVQFDQITPFLETLEMRQSGYKRLPKDLLKNLAADVKIVDDELRIIKSSSLNLGALKLETPALEVLRLQNVSVKLIPGGFLDGCPKLRNLKLINLRGNELARDLLRGASRLKTFILMANQFTTLPADFFTFTPNLTKIDLSNNQLESLPKDLFSGLNHLKILWLVDNHFTVSSLPDIASLTKLMDLQLSRNPLGDLCPPGGESSLSSLRRLEFLELAWTNVTRICVDWLSHTRLKLLYLWHNDIRSLSCSELPIIRDPTFLDSYIILKDNRISSTNCSREDFELVVSSPKPDQQVILWIDSILPCSCDTYWLQRVLRQRSVSLQGLEYHIDNPAHPNMTCVEKEIQCIPIQFWKSDLSDIDDE